MNCEWGFTNSSLENCAEIKTFSKKFQETGPSSTPLNTYMDWVLIWLPSMNLLIIFVVNKLKKHSLSQIKQKESFSKFRQGVKGDETKLNPSSWTETFKTNMWRNSLLSLTFFCFFCTVWEDSHQKSLYEYGRYFLNIFSSIV